jgi:hypothetical protein
MSIHAKRASVFVVGVVVLVTVFTIVRIARPLLSALGRRCCFMPTTWEMYSPTIWQFSTVFVASALLVWVFAYWLSKRRSRRPAARR